MVTNITQANNNNWSVKYTNRKVFILNYKIHVWSCEVLKNCQDRKKYVMALLCTCIVVIKHN